MTKEQAIEFALRNVPDILPLDSSSIKDMCNNILSQAGENTELIAQEFLNILGHSDLSFDFIFKFNELLSQAAAVASSANVKRSSPLAKTDDMIKNEEKVAVQPTPAKIRHTRPSEELLKPASHSVVDKPKKQDIKLQSLGEIDEVLKTLEVQASHNTNPAAYLCNCQARIHPLFEMAPNCLSCGKIICFKEGLHLDSCTFCGTELLSPEERKELVALLQSERENLLPKRQESSQGTKKKSNVFKLSNAKGANMFNEQQKIFDYVERAKEREEKRKQVLQMDNDVANTKQAAGGGQEIDEELAAAQQRLETLLNFQDTGAERMTIIDNASDFSMSNDNNLWGSAYEKALMLKRQQRNLKKWEKLEKQRNGRSDKVLLDLTIGSDGKAHFKQVNVENRSFRSDRGSDNETDDEDLDMNGFISEEELNDRTELKELKKRIAAEKASKAAMLSSKVWDYDKDKQQFEKPKYIPSQDVPHDDDSGKNATTTDFSSRIQVNKGTVDIEEIIAGL
ncbi:HBR452Cp [Eremothecium sinecaudum]|uniref:HBR452Cp n=1 Tax=Eremothecium sinecaudum TaxID=45286 RepID=A0A109UXH7_9SACH|nr:HBR452Cp [Eremothecium sinecaudum]AMD19353.1 HBR452Cp [Eremothecium sinecaudum]